MPFGRGTYASRSAMLGGNALKFAADAVIEKGKAFASFVLEASPSDITAGSRSSRWRKPLTARPAYRKNLGSTDYACRVRRSAGVRSRVEPSAGEDEPARRQGNGRAGCVGAPPAMIYAVLDALRPLWSHGPRHAGHAAAGLERNRRGGGARSNVAGRQTILGSGPALY